MAYNNRERGNSGRACAVKVLTTTETKEFLQIAPIVLAKKLIMVMEIINVLTGQRVLGTYGGSVELWGTAAPKPLVSAILGCWYSELLPLH